MATPLDPALLARRYRSLDTEEEAKQEALSLSDLRRQMLEAQITATQLRPEALIAERQRRSRELDIKSAAQKALERYQQGRLKALGPGGVKLKPGERMTEAGEVEQIPGSAEYLKQSKSHAAAYNDMLTTEDIAKYSTEKIDWILDPSRKDAFESNFGGWNAYATQYLPDTVAKGTQDMRVRIDSLKNDMMKAGLDLLRAGGSVGQMTQKEWPIVRDMIQKLSPTLSEAEAKQVLGEIRARFEAIRNNTKAAYETEWGGTQYQKRTGQRPSSSGSPAPKAGGMPSFATEEEAARAGLTPGTRIKVGGREGTWR